MSYDIYLPSYSIGEDVYERVKEVCAGNGSRAVVIGGHRAMAAVRDKLLKALCGSGIEITAWEYYGGEASYENVDRLSALETVKNADYIWGVGGGKATDTAKAVADVLKKNIYTFPTIASNCSACTSVSIMYREDNTFLRPYFFAKPPAHAFIDTQIIAAAPHKYMWAGMGDTYAKYFESTVSSRDEEVPHYVAQGVASSYMCYEPIMRYGYKGYTDHQNGLSSYEFEQVVLSIIVSTAVASILLTTDKVIDYNTGLGHAIFYALTAYPHIEKYHLHGEVVAYGILILLLVDGDEENFRRVYDFNKSVGLPVCLSDIGMSESELPKLVSATLAMKDIEHNPYKITEDMLMKAFFKLEEIND